MKRVIQGAVCVGVVILGILGIRLAFGGAGSRAPEGSLEGQPEVAGAPFAKAWTDRKVRLVGLGDSVTAGYGAGAGHGYFDRLAVNPTDEAGAMRGLSLSKVFPLLAARNHAVNGTNSIDHAGHVASVAHADGETVGVVVMTSGGNDVLQSGGRAAPREGAMFGATMEQARPWIAAFETRLDRMFTALEERFPGGCHIFIATIFDPTDGKGDIESVGLPAWPDGGRTLRAMNDAIRAAAGRHTSAHVVDVHGAFLGHGIHHGPKARWLQQNPAHPNEGGNDAMRRLFLNAIARVFAGG
jgi:lysophospholipase L1-like esterase